MEKQTDAVFVERCLNGDKNAFEELVERHQHRVFFIALRLMRDREEAADLAQETFVRAYTKLSTFKPGYSFKNWLLTICVNLGKNRLRGRERRRKAYAAYAENVQRSSGPTGTGRLVVEEALEKIPEKFLLPLVLKHIEGLSYEEVSRVMGIGVSAAKMRTKRARDLLVRLLDSSGGGDGE